MAFEHAWELVFCPAGPLVTTHTPPELRPAGVPVWTHDTRDRRVWREAIASTKDAWRRAYELEPPTRGEQALSALIGFSDGESITTATAPPRITPRAAADPGGNRGATA
jgi:hypothetical protein